MNSTLNLNKDKLHIFHESRKRRRFVAELNYIKEKKQYELIYDKHYVQLKNAIPIGPDLDLFTLRHVSKNNELFASLRDRIPSKANPAYVDYCRSQGISYSEKNPLVLLGSIGKRGPSSFVFEPVYHQEFSSTEIIKLREHLNITQHDLAEALDINKVTLQRIESGESFDLNTLKRLQILFTFPEVALWQLKQTGGRVHSNVQSKLVHYFSSADNLKIE